MNFTAKQARCHYENGNGIPLNIKDNIIEKIRDRSTDSTALYIFINVKQPHTVWLINVVLMQLQNGCPVKKWGIK